MTLPTSYVLSSQVLTVGPRPIARGSVDAYEGTFSGSKVCVKRVRVYSKDSPERVTKVFDLHRFFVSRFLPDL